MTEAETSRRNLLTGLAAAGVALPLVAACGSSGTDSTTTGSVPTTGSTPTQAPNAGGGGGNGGGIPTSEIPVGGGRIFGSQNVVVTQPKAGEFKAFSATCTHQGCPVNRVANGTIDCPCHGSQFSIDDGRNVRGPNGAPAGTVHDLRALQVSVNGSTLNVSAG